MDNTGWYAAASNLGEDYTAVAGEVKRQGRTTSFVTIELHDEYSSSLFTTYNILILKL